MVTKMPLRSSLILILKKKIHNLFGQVDPTGSVWNNQGPTKY